MAKKHRIHPQGSRYIREAVPQPRDVAEFVAPRTVNEGLSIKNVFGDVGDMIDPFITAAIEKQEGLRDVSDDELKMLAALGSIPVAGAVASKVTKKLNKLVPNPKGGFVRNPAYKEPMTRAQIEATDQAIKEWNKGVAINKKRHTTRPEDIPAPVEYEQKALNQINDYLSNQYKFTPKVSNATGMSVPNDNIVTRAILPEGVDDAGFLRHNPMMSNYDAVFKAVNQNVGKFVKEGKIKGNKPYTRFVNDPRYEGQYIIEYKTKDGDYRGYSDRAKRDMLLKIEDIFPGFLEAMSKPAK